MNRQMLNRCIDNYLENGGTIKVLKDRKHYPKLVPKKPITTQDICIAVKRIWFMGKLYLRRLN